MSEFSQFEAYTQILNLLRPKAPLKPMRGWAASPDFLLEVMREILASGKESPTIVELGSGVSTVVLGYLLENFFPQGRLLTLEHEYDFFIDTKEQLSLHSFKSVNLIFAPFSYYRIGNESFRFYDVSLLEKALKERKIDFLIVNGPPESTQKLAKYPALPLLREHLSDDFVLFLDDAKREDEKETVLRWKRELELYSSKEPPTEKGMLILRPLKGEKPFFSICIPTFNRRELLKEAIASAINQTYSNYEIVIYDDGSSDGTELVVEEFQKNSPIKIKYYKGEKNRGRPYARNFCIEKASGDWIVWLDDDDKLVPEYLSKIAEALIYFKDVEILYPKFLFLYHTSSTLNKLIARDFYQSDRELLRTLVSYSPIPNPGSCIKRAVYEKYGKYNKEFSRAEDYEFWSRAFPSAKRKAINAGVIYRVHSESGSSIELSAFWDTSYESVIKRRLLKKWNWKELFYEFGNERDSLTLFATELKKIGDYLNAAFYAWHVDNKALSKQILSDGGLIIKKRTLVSVFYSLIEKNPKEAMTIGERLGKSYYVLGLAAEFKRQGKEIWKKALIKSIVMNPFIKIPNFLYDAEIKAVAEASIDRILRKENKREMDKDNFIKELELEPETGRLHNSQE